ncbi:hypothetical protein [Mangrovihabitans endophyticus]|uniref:WD40-like Beta Propeller Repeat n=1 Tax=Mangrovihabitans endophyticus TaxID=1751298 RepID=A0A8J3BT33_9ACTN|nr:hypothetical protein [Mangrovihabitans endophyticus]GGK74768.1 hypothetical protein GCM10012284_05870 [Mangrovihabitans endophyticus]
MRKSLTVALGLLLAAGMTTPARAATVDPLISAKGTVAFQAADNRLWVTGITANGKSLNLDMMPGTSPAISPGTGQTTVLTGTVVFQGSNGDLWAAAAGSTASKDHGVPMAPGTNASITTDGARVAFQHANGDLWTTDGRSPVDTGRAMAPGTSPSAGTASRMAFQGADGFLWTLSGGRTSYAMAPGTSPAISQDGVIAFQGATGTLWIIRVGGATTDTGYRMAPGTSPGMSTMSKDWDLTRIAFQGDDGQLHTTAASVNRLNKDWGFDMMAGTSPTVSSDGARMAFHGANGHLQTMSENDTRRDLGYVLAAGTSPG